MMERQSVADVAQVYEFFDLAIGIAGDVNERAFARRRFVETADRHDRKQLAECPMVQQRLKDRKVAEELIAETVFEFADFLGNVRTAAKTLHDLLADFPIERFDFG